MRISDWSSDVCPSDLIVIHWRHLLMTHVASKDAIYRALTSWAGTQAPNPMPRTSAKLRANTWVSKMRPSKMRPSNMRPRPGTRNARKFPRAKNRIEQPEAQPVDNRTDTGCGARCPDTSDLAPAQT